LLRRVQQHLERTGFSVLIADRSDWGHLRGTNHDLLQAPELTESDVRFLESVSQTPFGQLRVPESRTGHCIGLMGRLFPEHHVLVVARNRDRVRRLTGQIKAQYKPLPKAQRRCVTMDTRQVWRHDPRMFVGTMELFRGACQDEFQIIVFADVQSARARHCQNLLRDRPYATWYAFTIADRPHTDYEQFRLEEIFGPVIVDESRDTRPVDVSVAFVEMQRGDLGCRDDGLARKRKQYWAY